MLALLKKDFFVLRKTCMVYLVLLLFYVAFGILSENFSMFQMLFTLIGMMLPITSMSYDERAKWDKYGMSLPLNRREVVLAKYLFTWIAMAVGAAFSILVVVLYTVLRHEVLTAQLFVPPLMFSSLGIALADIVLPIVYRLGTEKGRFVMVGVIWGVALIPVALVKLFDINIYTFAENVVAALSGGWIMLAVIAAVLVLTVISLLVSCSIYERKELS